MEHIYKFGNRVFDFKRAYVMGILNVTPDSFSDGGMYSDNDTAISYGLEMIEQGADIIDIGGESTRPGSDPVSADEEIDRVLPVIEKILNKKEDIIISIDTTKSIVAEIALKSGAKIVNDISGGTFDPEIFNVANHFDAGFVIMHIKGMPKSMQQNPAYDNLIQEVYDFLADQISIAKNAGLNKIFVDPGIGFGKNSEHNFELINKLSEFKSLSYPILIGLSRKSFIGKTLNLNVYERDNATNALNCLAINNGARVIRTHNVKLGVQTCRLVNEILVN